LGDWFPFRTYFLTSKASPNNSWIVIVIIIVVIGKAELILHGDGIIAQTHFLVQILVDSQGCTMLSQVRQQDNGLKLLIFYARVRGYSQPGPIPWPS
jgi:hypothetical protein